MFDLIRERYFNILVGFNFLAALCESKWKQVPYSGLLFVFRGRRGDLLKIVGWGGMVCLGAQVAHVYSSNAWSAAVLSSAT